MRLKTFAFFSGVLDFEIVAGKDLAGFSTQVHASALAVAPHLAVTAFTRLHPLAVTVQFETVLPEIPEIIGMDITLIVVTAYAEAA